MSSDQQQKVKGLVKRLVERLKATNIEAQKKGAPHIAGKEYRELERELVRKMVRT